ncbi:hypothetical protein [Spirosoma spitsbergense]|uniref:hypothetical protein n=1 Tax=Spirosoma spitsbergense TaxID=431554 RepID=UPI0012F9C0B0|nr:hypothetical protein [Spirosoma spitsbergense]
MHPIPARADGDVGAARAAPLYTHEGVGLQTFLRDALPGDRQAIPGRAYYTKF